MIENILNNIRDNIESWLTGKGVAKGDARLEQAARPEFGEYSSNAAMVYAKELKQAPFTLAEDLVAFLQAKKIAGVEKIEVVKPGFINFFLTPTAKTQHALNIIQQKSDFGKNQTLKGQKWVVEHTSPNPNKAMHIGHLRINLIGMGIVRLLEEAGAKVIADGVYNDRGISIAKVMYGYLAHMKKDVSQPTDITYWAEHKDRWYTPAEKDMKPDVFVSECYVLGEKDFKNDELVEKMTRQMVVDWEAEDKVTWELWRQVLSYAYEGHERVLKRLGSRWDKIWYEHEHYKLGKKYVEEGLKKRVFQKLEDGAVLTKLEEYGLPDTIVLKRDGTSLYITQDIALTDLKKKTYDADKLVWVIGPEQGLAMKQLFAVCEQLGIGKLADFTHVSYGNVGLKSADGKLSKMSSRTGSVVLADDVIDEVKAKILKRFEEEDRHDSEKREQLAEKLALAAVKFGFLKSDKMQDMAFDPEQSVDVQGDSGMYVLYTYVRTQSILRKAGEFNNQNISEIKEFGSESDLVRSLLYYENVIEKSVAELSIHHVAQYLLEVSAEFNSWYGKETILDGGDREVYKLAVVAAVAVVIKNGLSLLGIETVEEM